MGNRPPRLPLEIIDSVIDEVEQFRDLNARVITLASCALVCRQWRTRARRCLFDVVVFNTGAQRRMDAFRKLLSSPHCTILSSVRLVQAELRGRDFFLPDILSDLSVLRDLTTFDLSATNLASNSECFANYRSLTTLVFSACIFATWRDAAQLVGGCFGLESLSISSSMLGDKSRFPPASRPVTRFGPPPPRLKRLFFENNQSTPDFFSWLCTGETSLTDISIRGTKPGELPSISALARHAGPKLLHLTIGLDPTSADTILGSEELHLHTCTSLCSLTLENVPPRGAHAIAFLERMKWHHAEELTLVFGSVDVSWNRIGVFPWMHLAVVLEQQPSFGSLERLGISGWCPPNEMLAVEEALKRLRTRRRPLEIVWS